MKRNSLTIGSLAVAALAIIAFSLPAHAQVVDQSNLVGDINWAIHGASDTGQTFTMGTPGMLAGLELSLVRCATPSNPLILEILTVSGGQPQQTPVLASITIPAASIPTSGPLTSLTAGSVTGTYIDLTGANIVATNGTQFAFHLTTAESPGCYAIRGDTVGNYAGGMRFTMWTVDPTNDLVFKSFVQATSPVPASSPLTVLLLIAVLAAAGWVALRR